MGFLKRTISATSKTIGNVVDTAGKGVSSVAYTAQKGVTSVAHTGVKGVTTVAGGVKTVASTGVNAVATVGEVGVKGVTTVASTGVKGVTNVAGAASGAVGGVTRTLSKMKTNEKKHVREADLNARDIFCSDLYTVDYVIGAIEDVKKKREITTVTFEDCSMRGDQAIFKAAIHLITETAVKVDDAEINPNERVWQSITFLECISSAEDYDIYTSEKKQFQALLRRMLKMKGISSMPIKFQTKIEIHSFMNMDDAIQLLDVIGKDPTILAVKFPHLTKEKKRIPGRVLDHFNSTTLEFKEDASPILINIRYGGKKTTEQTKAVTRIIKVCSQKLRKVAEQLKSGDLPPLGEEESSSSESYSEIGTSFRMSEGVVEAR